MSNEEKIIISRLLRMAEEKFSNHGCNDLPSDFWDGISEECKETIKKEAIEIDYGGEEYSEALMGHDSLLMDFFADKLEKQ